MLAGHNGPEAEANEVLVSPQAHAVASPGTVVVHAHNALLADAAVMAPWWLDVLALLAVPEADEGPTVIVNIDCPLVHDWLLLKQVLLQVGGILFLPKVLLESLVLV